MRVAFHTLGCKVNQNDTESLIAMFRERGHHIVGFNEKADAYIINTCAVTNLGERKSRQSIRRAIASEPDSIIVVTGCYAQTSPGEIAELPGVDLVVGMAERPQLATLVEDYLKDHIRRVKVGDISNERNWSNLPISHLTGRTRATLKVEEGCDQFCSYCIVPLARGRVRSMPIDEAVNNFKLLVEKGYREIVLTGIHLGSYGKDQGLNLADLLTGVLKIEGEFRIRLGSIEPNDFGEELLKMIINNNRVCQYLHIPLQSGSDRILKLMNRHYSLTGFSNLLAQIRSRNPLFGIGTDLIVGFPGETEADFLETCRFLEEQAFSRIHVFRFSPRKGTAAATMKERVAGPIQEERSHKVQEIASRTSAEFARKFLGKQVEVLCEEKTVNGWSGLTSEYLKTEIQSDSDLKNVLVNVLVKGIAENALEGVCLRQ